MKIKEKLKKCITGVGAFFTTITTKVFATDVNSILMEINGASAGEELYGIVNPLQDVYLFSNYVLKICKTFTKVTGSIFLNIAYFFVPLYPKK